MNLSFVFLLGFLPLVACTKYKFRPIKQDYNQQLQEYCGNPQFLKKQEATKKIMHGEPAAKGKYPWSVVMKKTARGMNGDEIFNSHCGGTIISPRHILTARHCFDNRSPGTNITIMLGGVCYAEGEFCDKVDMRVVEYEFAAYMPKEPGEDANKTIKLANHLHDIAIVQLTKDLEHFNGKEGDKQSVRDTRPACFPQMDDTLPGMMQVYGWGTTDKHQYGAHHLMEVTLPLLDMKTDPIVKSEGWQEKKELFTSICSSPDIFCTHSPEKGNLKDSAGGDSGTGVVGRKGHLAFLYGWTIAGDDKLQLGHALKTQAYEKLLCFYTGVCTQKDWLTEGMQEWDLPIQLKAFYDPEQERNLMLID